MKVEDAFLAILKKTSWQCTTDSASLYNGVCIELERYPLHFQTFTGNELVVKCDVCSLPDEVYEPVSYTHLRAHET